MTAELPAPNGSMGFFEAGLDVVACRLEAWRRTHAWFRRSPWGLVVAQVSGSLGDGLGRLPPWGPRQGRELLWECVGGQWTAYFDSRVTSDAITAVSGLCDQTGMRGVLITDHDSHLARGRDLQFVIYEGLETVRAVGLMWEGRWDFDTYGQPLPFEETDRYERRLKRERLTPEMLERYCAHLGLHPYDPAFYGRRGVLFNDMLPDQKD